MVIQLDPIVSSACRSSSTTEQDFQRLETRGPRVPVPGRV